MGKFLVIADDFTGANDTGVQLRKKGIKTFVVYNTDFMKDDSISYVLDTESRGLCPSDSYNKLKKSLINIMGKEFDFIYKKVDSTLRGNIASEINAVSEISDSQVIIFAPAYPENKRTVIEGELLLNGIKVSETEIGRDPKTPVHESNIKKLLQAGFNKDVVHYSLENIRKGNLDFEKGGIYTFDTEIEEDFKYIIGAASNSGKRVLWCGSAGLANSLINYMLPSKPVLGVIGSVSDVSREQVKFASLNGCSIVNADVASIIQNNDIYCYINEAVKSIQSGNDTLITSALGRKDYEQAVAKSRKIGIAKEDVSSLTQNILSEITLKVLKRTEVSGLFLTGGDTAIGIIESLKADSAEMLYELMPGIPLIRINGGICDGLKAVTKAGAFGNNEAITFSIKKLKEDIL